MTRALTPPTRTALAAVLLTLLGYLLNLGASLAADRLCAPEPTALCNPLPALLFANLLIANALMVTFAVLYARERKRNVLAMQHHLQDERREPA